MGLYGNFSSSFSITTLLPSISLSIVVKSSLLGLRIAKESKQTLLNLCSLHISKHKPLVYNDYLPSIWLSKAWLSFAIISLTSLVLDKHCTIARAEWTAIAQCAKFMPPRALTFEQNLHTNLIELRPLTYISVYFAELRTLYDAFVFP